ncbi:hypothetical protein F5141DRAFT_772692 [Pisolithus sp. B1]|nr:hypothetical protein F5141DRAFT_772692 [Pisolithus sp. B1]
MCVRRSSLAQRWRAMRAINELIMIGPVILNLKGNLEMNLSARLGTAVNMGSLDDPRNRRNIICGNLALHRIQAAVVASVSMALGSIVPDPPSTAPISFRGEVTNSTTLLSRAPRPLPMSPGQPKSGVAEFIAVASSAMMPACLSSVLLGSFMCALIVACRRSGLDSGLGSPLILQVLPLTTLSQTTLCLQWPPVSVTWLHCLLAAVSSLLIDFINALLPSILVLCLVLSATSCFFIVRRNSCVKDLIWRGWLPLFGAMVISSATGIVLDIFASRYWGFPLLAVVISGLPGGVGSIAISPLSTLLHAENISLTHEERSHPKSWSRPLFSSSPYL